MSNNWPAAAEGRIPTKNKTGFMFLEINGASPQFIQQVPHCTDLMMDLGCAYGIVTLAALPHAQCPIIAFDLSKEHLDILNSSVPKEYTEKLTIIPGRFPQDFTFSDNSFDAIHSSYMFHFLNGSDTEKGLEKCFNALKPSGKIYINTVSVYFKPFKGILTIYQENLKAAVKWPGMILDFKNHLPEEDVPYAPEFIHTHRLEDFESLLKNAGFLVDKIFYYDLKTPKSFASEGKGFIGAVATKPK